MRMLTDTRFTKSVCEPTHTPKSYPNQTITTCSDIYITTSIILTNSNLPRTKTVRVGPRIQISSTPNNTPQIPVPISTLTKPGTSYAYASTSTTTTVTTAANYTYTVNVRPNLDPNPIFH